MRHNAFLKDYLSVKTLFKKRWNHRLCPHQCGHLFPWRNLVLLLLVPGECLCHMPSSVWQVTLSGGALPLCVPLHFFFSFAWVLIPGSNIWPMELLAGWSTHTQSPQDLLPDQEDLAVVALIPAVSLFQCIFGIQGVNAARPTLLTFCQNQTF